MKTNTTLKLAILMTAIFIAACQANPNNQTQQETSEIPKQNLEIWNEVATGLSFRTFHVAVGTEEKDLLMVKVDPSVLEFSIYQNKDHESAKTIREIHQTLGSLLTFNGGYFTEDFKPTGLLMSQGEKLRKISKAELLDGIFAITKNGAVNFLRNWDTAQEKNYDFAIQNGPVIIDENGNITITKDSGKLASRTAMGLDKNGNLIVIVIKQSLLKSDNTVSLYEFAHLLKENPELAEFDLHSVLNLDGGPSTGLMIGENYYPEMEKVQNIVIVKNR